MSKAEEIRAKNTARMEQGAREKDLAKLNAAIEHNLMWTTLKVGLNNLSDMSVGKSLGHYLAKNPQFVQVCLQRVSVCPPSNRVISMWYWYC